MNNETTKLTEQEKVLAKNSTEGPVDNVAGLSAKDTLSPNRRARRNAKKTKGGIYAQEEISYEERAFRNRKKKLAKQSKKRNR